MLQRIGRRLARQPLHRRAALRVCAQQQLHVSAAARGPAAPVPHECAPPLEPMEVLGGQPVYDVAVVGGGIVGLATARELLRRHPKLHVAVVEKEQQLATHQSARNSGVIHAGIYYAPGSLRAKLCVAGSKLMYAYCRQKGIRAERVGKLIVAVRPDELPRLEQYYQRSLQNAVPGVEMKSAAQIAAMEPRIRGLRALWSPETGVTDFAEVARHYGEDVRRGGGHVFTGFRVEHIQRTATSIRVSSAEGAPLYTRHVIACAGLYSDRVAAMTGASPKPAVVPFRGTWYALKPEYCDFVRTNIYPVANPAFPFLGVHFTPTVRGDVLLGPNAALATAREGYDWRVFNARDAAEIAANPGLARLIARNLGFALGELLNELSPARTLRQLQAYMPSLRAEHLAPTTRSGVRAQALGDDGGLVDDFLFERQSNVLHVRNAPSPGATSSLAIAQMVADRALAMFQDTNTIRPHALVNSGAPPVDP